MSCPVCQFSEFKKLSFYEGLNKYTDKTDLVECQKCGHFYLRGIEDGEFDDFFEEGKYELLDTRKSIFDSIKYQDAKRVFNVLNNRGKSFGKLLDFGCGKGLFLSFLDKKKWYGLGVETARSRAEFGRRQYDVKILSEFYEEGAIEEGNFDVICLFHVLEHLDQPKHLLQKLIKDNLKQDGVLIIEVPLFNSWQSRIAGRNWIQLDPPLHISHFTKTSLDFLLKNVGMTTVKTQYFSYQLGLLGMVQSLMSKLGYKGDYIADLKFNRTAKLLLGTALIFPLAFILEMISCLFKRGGVIRIYAQKA